MDRKAGSKSIRRSSTKGCGCAPIMQAYNSMNSTRRVTPRTSRPKPNTSLNAFRMSWSRGRRAKKVCATCATSRRFTARRELQFKAVITLPASNQPYGHLLPPPCERIKITHRVRALLHPPFSVNENRDRILTSGGGQNPAWSRGVLGNSLDYGRRLVCFGLWRDTERLRGDLLLVQPWPDDPMPARTPRIYAKLA